MRRIFLLTALLICAGVQPVTVRTSALPSSDEFPGNDVETMEITTGRIDPCRALKGCARTVCNCASAIADLDVERIIYCFGDEKGLCSCYDNLPPELKKKIKTRCHKGASGSRTFQEEGYGDSPCICTEEYNPVCGLDGKNYSNLCILHCAGTKLDHYGLCNDKGCNCTFIYLPVCGEDGKTYGNECSAKCANVTIAYDGICQEGIKCGKGIQPALCFRDPCDGYETCPSYPNATCISNYCPGITQFRGSYVNGPCTAIYVDPHNGKPVDCCKDQNDIWASENERSHS